MSLTGPPTMTPIDVEHLRLLKIFHYVMAGINLFLALLYLCGTGMFGMFAVLIATQSDEEIIPALVFFGFGGCFYFLFFLLTAGYAYLVYFTGKSLGEHRRYIFCIVMSALDCTGFPFGMILGVCTIMVLARPAVKAAFEAKRELRAEPQPASAVHPVAEEPA